MSFKKIGSYSNKKNLNWLLSQGYRVIELDYKKNKNAKGDKSKDDSKKQKPERAKKQAPKKEIVQILIAYKLYKPAV